MSEPTYISRIQFDEDTAALPADVAQQTLIMVNVAYIGDPGSGDWVLIDAGLPGMAARIVPFAHERFGGNPPRAILLTHGHFDHVGGLHALLEAWPDVPVYAHRLELPYLTGKSEYPPPDPTVGGGMMARLSPLYPKGPYDFGDRIQPLPEDGSVPLLADWRCVPTPGHSPGHVSFFRESDATLIAGDAFITQKQESLIGVLTAAQELRGPPRYFTPDWESARSSVQTLAGLRPRAVITGHGHPMAGENVAGAIDAMVANFDHDSIPAKGRYVDAPAVADESGVVSLPPKPADDFSKLALVGGAVALGVVAAFVIARRKQCASREEVARGPQLDECE